MTTLKRVLLILLTVVWCVGCDQATKSIAKSHLPKSRMLSFVGDTVRLQYTENKGAFLTLGKLEGNDIHRWSCHISARGARLPFGRIQPTRCDGARFLTGVGWWAQ